MFKGAILRVVVFVSIILVFYACSQRLIGLNEERIHPVFSSESTFKKAKGVAIWENKADFSKSLIIGSDEGGLYVYDLDGKLVNKHLGLKKANSIDIAYDFILDNQVIDIVVIGELERKKVRVFSLPDLIPIDVRGIDVFDNEGKSEVLFDLSLFKDIDTVGNVKQYVLVASKTNNQNEYFRQYELIDNGRGSVEGKYIRKFGQHISNNKNVSISVNEKDGYVYYCDNGTEIKRHTASPDIIDEKSNVTLIDKFDFEIGNMKFVNRENDYLLLSNVNNNTFLFYAKEGKGEKGKDIKFKLLEELYLLTKQSNDFAISLKNFGGKFSRGLFIGKGDDRKYQYYDLGLISDYIALQ
ncbi:phytase [Myroides injenensis]|uniref:phytase n=1 Tax=Myroides injenensis TaxID=1183151 RepID=UPI00028872B8|nr:phytase [Myroides injenensis]